MPTVMTHALVGWGLARATRAVRPPEDPLARRCESLAAALAMAPDLDVIAFSVGIPYAHPLGHRGLSHSLAVGIALGLGTWILLWLALRLLPRPDLEGPKPSPGACDLGVLCLAACSHGVLDMLTDGGLGVALFAPFDHARLFFPVTPVPVSPIGLVHFFADGLPVLAWEFVLLCPLGLAGLVVGSKRPPRFKLAGTAVLALALIVAWSARL